MTPPPGTCQCSRSPFRSCSSAITQEDLLCDTCRAVRDAGAACWVMPVLPDEYVHFGVILADSGFSVLWP